MLNELQKKVVDSDSKRIVCLAGAGSGKSYTLLSRIDKLVDSGISADSILALTFTNAAAREMLNRYKKNHGGTQITPKFSTFHAFCYSLIVNNRDVRGKLGYSKIPMVCVEATLKRITTEAEQATGIKKSDDAKTLSEKREQEVLTKYIRKKLIEKNMITFDIMCYEVCQLFTQNDDSIKQYFDKYKCVFVDEFQDTDKLQWSFVESFKNSQIFVCGDVLQCQPAGTKITMSDMTEKNIEDIKIGDRVLTYNAYNGSYVKYTEKAKHAHTKRVLGISKHYADNVVRIVTADVNSCYTKDHITYARVHYEGNEDKYAVYIMSNEKGWWRVGTTKLFIDDARRQFGVRTRMRNDKGNRVWILSICDTATEAWIIEQRVAYKFGIPKIQWTGKSYDEYKVSFVYSVLPNIESNVIECLAEYGRAINYPIFTTETVNKRYSKSFMFECRVGSLIPKIFDIVHMVQTDNDLENEFEQILGIEDVESQNVYGLNVEDNHNYVGDGILTHNCIYQFRGADDSIIKSLCNDDKWDKYRLKANYRSDKSIVDYANEFSIYADESYRVVMDNINGDGIVTECQYRTVDEQNGLIIRHIDKSKDTAILARTNKEVYYIQQLLKSSDIPFRNNHTTPNGIGIDLCKSIEDVEYAVDWLSSLMVSDVYNQFLRESLSVSVEEQMKLLHKFIGDNKFLRGIYKHYNYLKKLHGEDDIERIRKYLIFEVHTSSRINECTTVNEIVTTLETNSDDTNSIYVGTIHSVKGLEFDNVIVTGVNSKSFNLDYDENKNLFYVAVTRAKHNLTVLRRY